MTDTEILDFSSGAQDAEEFAKKEKAARDAARGSSAYFSLKNDGDTAILRFLFEADQKGVNDPSAPIGPDNPPDPKTGWIWTKQHSFVKTKPAPRDKPPESAWPESVGAICRRTPIGPQQKPAFPDCFICSNIKNDRGQKDNPTLQLWASAVLREEVVGTPELVAEGRIHESQIGKRLILDQQDYVDELDDDGTTTGKKVWKKRCVIVNMAVTNFFSPLTTMAGYYHTILDRDYRITRKGEPRARRVDYVPFALDPYQVSVMRDGAVATIGYDLREPEIAALYDGHGLRRADLLEIIGRRISTEYYNKYFDPRVEVSWKDFGRKDDDKDKPASAPDAPPPPPLPTPQQQAGQSITREPTSGVTAEALAAMRDRVMGGNRAPAAAAPPPAPAADSAPSVPSPAQADAPPPLVR